MTKKKAPAPKRAVKKAAPVNADAVTGQGALFGPGDPGTDAGDIADARLLLPQALAAIVFNISIQSLQRWKVKPRMKRGRERLYYLPDLVHYRINRDQTGKLNLDDERARLAAFQADSTGMEIDEMRGNLIPVDQVIETWSTITSSIRQRF